MPYALADKETIPPLCERQSWNAEWNHSSMHLSVVRTCTLKRSAMETGSSEIRMMYPHVYWSLCCKLVENWFEISVFSYRVTKLQELKMLRDEHNHHHSIHTTIFRNREFERVLSGRSDGEKGAYSLFHICKKIHCTAFLIGRSEVVRRMAGSWSVLPHQAYSQLPPSASCLMPAAIMGTLIA